MFDFLTKRIAAALLSGGVAFGALAVTPASAQYHHGYHGGYHHGGGYYGHRRYYRGGGMGQLRVGRGRLGTKRYWVNRAHYPMERYNSF